MGSILIFYQYKIQKSGQIQESEPLRSNFALMQLFLLLKLQQKKQLHLKQSSTDAAANLHTQAQILLIPLACGVSNGVIHDL